MAVNELFGSETAWHCEVDPAACQILKYRWPSIRNLGDITKVQWDEVEKVDILCGGSPCQDVSQAGRRAGMYEGTRSNLWREMVSAIEKLHPKLVIWENVRGVLNAPAFSSSDMERGGGLLDDFAEGHLRALGRVLGDFTSIGLNAEWGIVRASDVGAPHHRARIFLLAWPSDQDPSRIFKAKDQGENATNSESVGWPVRNAENVRPPGGKINAPANYRRATSKTGRHRRDERCTRSGGLQSQKAPGEPNRRDPAQVDFGIYTPAVERWERLTRPAPCPIEIGPNGGRRLAAPFAEWMMGLPDGWVTSVPEINRRDQLKAIGNGVCPQQARAAIKALIQRVESNYA